MNNNSSFLIFHSSLHFGEVRERPKRHAWKACNPQGFKSSNLFLSVLLRCVLDGTASQE